MMYAADAIATPAYYEKLADELETIAEKVRQNPEIIHGNTVRLDELAKKIREGANRIRSKSVSQH